MDSHAAWSVGAQHLLNLCANHHLNSFVRSASHFLESCLLIAALVGSLSHCHSVQAYLQNRTVLSV